jgi:hypothetical protein
MQFFPRDWLTAPDLRACSPPARAFWLDTLCLMWECPKRGVLKTSGHAWGIAEIAAATGSDPRSCQEWLNELLKMGVTERRKIDGALINRRMIREEKQRKKWRKWQKTHRDSSNDCHNDVMAMSTVDVRSHINHKSNTKPAASPRFIDPKIQTQRHGKEVPLSEQTVQKIGQRYAERERRAKGM